MCNGGEEREVGNIGSEKHEGRLGTTWARRVQRIRRDNNGWYDFWNIYE